MKFDTEHKVMIESMTAEEAKVFIVFLQSEIARHYVDILDATELIEEVEVAFDLTSDE